MQDSIRSRRAMGSALQGSAQLFAGGVGVAGALGWDTEQLAKYAGGYYFAKEALVGAGKVGRWAGGTAIGGAMLGGSKAAVMGGLSGAGGLVGGGAGAGLAVGGGILAAGAGGALGIDALQNGERSLLPSLMKLKDSSEALARSQQRRADLLNRLGMQDRIAAETQSLRVQMIHARHSLPGVGEFSPSQDPLFLAKRNRQRADDIVSDLRGELGTASRNVRGEIGSDSWTQTENTRQGAFDALQSSRQAAIEARKTELALTQRQTQEQVRQTQETIQGLKQQQQAHRDLAQSLREGLMGRQEKFGQLNPMQQDQLLRLKQQFDAGANLSEDQLRQLEPFLGCAEGQRLRGIRMDRGAAIRGRFGIGDEGQAQHADRQAAALQKQVEQKEEAVRAIEQEGQATAEAIGQTISGLMVTFTRAVTDEIKKREDETTKRIVAEFQRNEQAKNQQKGRAGGMAAQGAIF